LSKHVKKNTNTSGYSGVNWSKAKKKWHAKICIDYKRIHLGYFADISDAIIAYENALKKYELKESEMK
jgi:hypothetical protein